MARITVEDCLQVVPSRFDLIIMASKRTLEEDVLMDGFSTPDSEVTERAE